LAWDEVETQRLSSKLSILKSGSLHLGVWIAASWKSFVDPSGVADRRYSIEPRISRWLTFSVDPLGAVNDVIEADLRWLSSMRLMRGAESGEAVEIEG